MRCVARGGCRRLELKCRARLRILYGAVCRTVRSQTLTVSCFGPCSSKTVARTRPFFSGARSALFSTRALSGVTVRVLCVQFVVPSSRLTQVCPRTFTLRLVYVLRVVLPFEPYNPDFCEPRTDAYGMRTACTRHAHNTHNACTPHAHTACTRPPRIPRGCDRGGARHVRHTLNNPDREAAQHGVRRHSHSTDCTRTWNVVLLFIMQLPPASSHRNPRTP